MDAYRQLSHGQDMAGTASGLGAAGGALELVSKVGRFGN